MHTRYFPLISGVVAILFILALAIAIMLSGNLRQQSARGTASQLSEMPSPSAENQSAPVKTNTDVEQSVVIPQALVESTVDITQ